MRIDNFKDIADILREMKKAKELEQLRLLREKAEKERLEAERVESVLNMDLSLDFENTYKDLDIEGQEEIESIPDAFVSCLNALGRVDIEYISKLSGQSMQDCIKTLKGTILQNPDTWEEKFYKGWETKDEYLVGNLKNKYKAAVEQNKKYNGLFDENINQIMEASKNLPYISMDEIYIALGSPWIPDDIIEEFILSILRASRYDTCHIKHDKKSGTYKILAPDIKATIRSRRTYGTDRMSAIDIIEKTMNQSPIVVYDRKYDPKKIDSLTGKPKKIWVKNEKETLLALEKQRKIEKEFKEFIDSDKKRRDRLEKIYNDTYCQNFVRIYDGSFLKFPDLSDEVKLFDYQKNAIARIIFSPNTLLAHDVGSGKTYEMICAGHELKRMGLSNKNMFVVPNNITSQWKDMYKKAYPNAQVLTIEPKNFTKGKRNDVLNDIMYNDYDAIIISYSCFDMIHMSPKHAQDKLKEEFEEAKDAYNDLSKRTDAVVRSFKSFENGKLEEKLKKIGDNEEGSIHFEDLEIDRLFVDEAHNYKNIPLDSDISAAGINSEGSKKCSEMLEKVHYIQSNHDGGGVIFATGTPITNSITDAYTIEKYLQPAMLDIIGLTSFRSWIGNYAERETNYEIDVDSQKFVLKSRFSKFHNLPELSSNLSSIADFHHIDHEVDLPEFNGYKDIVIERNVDFSSYMNDISNRADLVRARNPRLIRRGETAENDVYDNMLLITTDGRKAALDIRLVNPTSSYSIYSKVYRCARKVADIYSDTQDFKGTQLIFCDTSTPKATFNIYDELRRLLESFGVKSSEIEYIHNADTDSKRKVLFDKVQNGEIRVLIGSTFKLGMGVNVQKRLYAIHHIDIPWRPADMVQREGRILRPGNENKEIFIYRYITEMSFDAYSWQLLEIKQNFISKLLSNNVFDRDGTDIEDTALNYSEVKALAIGNPLMKTRYEKINELQRLKSLERSIGDKKRSLSAEIASKEARLPMAIEDFEKAKRDLEHIDSLDLIKLEKEERAELKDKIYRTVLSSMDSREEPEICDFYGFKVVAPKYQFDAEHKLYIKMVREGSYRLNIGTDPLGVIQRMVNFIKSFSEKIVEPLKSEIKQLNTFIKDGKRELERKESYTEDIDRLEIEIENLDKKLNIKKEDK